MSTEGAGAQIGRYRLLEPIGEGGYGMVWMAEQAEPVRRRVALKVIKLGMDTRQVVARFEAERQALALMDHQNIARVFDGGATDNGRPYFVMELVRGLPLTAYCDAAKLGVRERVALLIQVSQAVQHAHQKGIIHRDIKPSNVLVTEQDGKAVPKVIDFGIAKATGAQLTDKTLFTRFSQMIGTPAYMSPEQAGLGSLDIDTRSDIYSLGVLLYELLTGRTPIDPRQLRNSSHDAVLKSVREVEPPRPSTCLRTLAVQELIPVAARRGESPDRLVHSVHGDLDWIVLRALEKDRTRRYASAQDLAADLQRFLDNEPIVARPPGNLYRLQKLARRNKLAFVAGGAVLVALIAGLATTSWQWLQATQNSREARLNAYVTEVGLAQQALAANNLGRALELLRRQQPGPGDGEELRGFEWRYLWQLARPGHRDVMPGNRDAVAFSPDGRLLAVSEQEQTTISEMPARTVLARIPRVAATLSFSPVDPVLAVGGFRQVSLWDTNAWIEVRPPLPGATYPALFSPDGKWLITGATNAAKEPPRHILWRTGTWEPVRSCEASPQFPTVLRYAVAFSPDSSVLVTPWTDTGGRVCTLRLWKLPNLEPLGTLPPDTYGWSAAFLPDGRHLLIGTFMGELIVWDLQESREVQRTQVVTGIVTTVCAAPDGRHFITTGNQGTLFVWEWDGRAGEIRRRYLGHEGAIWASAISPDGRQIVTGGWDGTARLWDGGARESSSRITAGGLIAGFMSESERLVLAPSQYDYRWQIADLAGRVHAVVEVPTNPPIHLTVSEHPFDAAGSRSLGALGRADGTVELWDLATGRLRDSWAAHTNEVSVTTWSPDGTLLATGDKQGQVKLWDTRTREQRASFDRPSRPAFPVAELVFSPDGQELAGGWWEGRFGDVVLWDVNTGNHLRSLTGLTNDCVGIAFSPDGRWLAAGSNTDALGCVWDLTSDEAPKVLRGHATSVVGLAFSPDGRTLATGSYDTIKLRKVPTFEEVVSFPTERALLRGLHFSPDGRTLAAGYIPYTGGPKASNFVNLHQAPALEEIAVAEAAEQGKREE